MKKSILLLVSNRIGLFWRMIPAALRLQFLSALFLFEMGGKPDKSLKTLFRAQSNLTKAINHAAMRFGDGMHPKHRLTRYHQFFVTHIEDGDRVLDIGSGLGWVARTVAANFESASVLGLDSDGLSVSNARKLHSEFSNLHFMEGDATIDLPDFEPIVIIFSNVLEHIDKRVDFLSSLRDRYSPRVILIRVPAYERSWETPFQRELGLNYFSDPEHFIEHSRDELIDELEGARLNVESLQACWGEYWVKVSPE